MSNTLKISGAIRVGKLSGDPANPEKGLIYYNTTSDELRHYNGTGFVQISSQDELDAILGTLDGSPANYTPTGATHSGHLAGIDTALASAGGTEFADDVFRFKGSADASKKVAIEVDGLTTSTTRTITMPDSNVDLGDISTNNAKVSADGLVTTHSDVSDAGSGAIITGAERTKLSGIETSATADQTGAEIKTAYEAEANAYTDTKDTKLSGIETAADVTDSTNVAAAGAVMESDSSTASMSFVIDEDAMGSDSATKVPTQQSVKAYVDTEVGTAVTNGMAFKGDYNASTNSPDLDSSPIATSIGDTYVTTVAGTFFTIPLEIGDTLIAKQNTATLEAHWTVVQANLTAASIKTQYESNADTNEVTDSEKTALGNLSGTNSGDESAASTTVAGIIELATVTETDTGTATNRAVTPAGLVNIQSDVDTNTAKVGYSAATAKADVVNDSISDGNTDTAPSENAVFDALAGKMGALYDDTTPNLGGDLILGNNTVIHDANGMQRGTSSSNFLEEEYIHSIALSGSQTGTVISALTFAHASFEGFEMMYKIKETTSGDIRIGTLRVVTNGTSISANDVSTETADTGIVFSAAINGANVEIKYDSGTNGATIRCDVKRIKA